MADYLTAPCSVCGRQMRLLKDGTIGHHGGIVGDAWPYRRAYRCDGAGRPPAGQQAVSGE